MKSQDEILAEMREEMDERLEKIGISDHGDADLCQLALLAALDHLPLTPPHFVIVRRHRDHAHLDLASPVDPDKFTHLRKLVESGKLEAPPGLPDDADGLGVFMPGTLRDKEFVGSGIKGGEIESDITFYGLILIALNGERRKQMAMYFPLVGEELASVAPEHIDRYAYPAIYESLEYMAAER